MSIDEEELFANVEYVDHVIDENKLEESYYDEDDDHKIRENEYEENLNEERDEDRANRFYEDEEKAPRKGESYINPGPEWRSFVDNPKSFDAVRTGQALAGDRMLSTMIEKGKGKDKRLQRIHELVDKTSRTDEEMFNIALVTWAFKLNIDSKVRDGIIEHIVPNIKKIKYKNSLVTLLAYVCIEHGKLKKDRVPVVLEDVTRGTNLKSKIREPDIFRYAFMILNILKRRKPIL
jgi:hypothetical protein